MRAKIAEIYLPARYGDEKSSMSLSRVIFTFPGKLLRGYLYRVYHKYVFRSLSPFALLLISGIVTMLWGIFWGGLSWWRSYATQVPATTGTVILALMPLLLGWSSLLQALVLDVQDAGPCLLFDYDDDVLKFPALSIFWIESYTRRKQMGANKTRFSGQYIVQTQRCPVK